jgi:spore coat polysaccharide biosynthesis protein SpsF
MDIVKLCAKNNTRVFCGSENDVLDRFFQLAKIIQPKHIVRITANCPLIDPKIIDQVIEKHLAQKADYTSNVLKETFPDGQDIEVFNFNALKKAWKDSVVMSARVHVTQHIRNHPNEFTIVSCKNNTDLSKKRWTLDNKEDFKFITAVYDGLYSQNPFFGLIEVLQYLRENPKLELINNFIRRNEGLKKSLREDKILDKKPEE